jgi:hypothetical protein
MDEKSRTIGGSQDFPQETVDLNKYCKVTGPLSSGNLEHMRKDFPNRGQDIDKLDFDIVPKIVQF